MNIAYHRDAARGRWNAFSLFEQMGHIGSEISRARRWQYGDPQLFERAVERALELFDLTMADARWRGGRLRELARARELFCNAALNCGLYQCSLEELQNYFDSFITNKHSRGTSSSR